MFPDCYIYSGQYNPATTARLSCSDSIFISGNEWLTHNVYWSETLNQRAEILDGIEEELRIGSRYLKFKVVALNREGAIWKLTVAPANKSSSLDESMEGAAAWWAGPPPGSADILSVIPESDQVNIRYLTSPPPSIGQEIRIYPPKYLESLQEIWELDSWAATCMNWFEKQQKTQPDELLEVDEIEGFSKLRARQRQAFGLLDREFGFLWGPPGTGKTTTLGAMLAKYICKYPSHKVLLLATTNSAVDQALISVDKSLEHLSKTDNSASALRKKCLRLGNHFIASNYAAREHLLPTQDEQLIRRLAELETKVPDPSDVTAYAQWKDKIRALRQQIPRPIDQARVAAMTTTGAAFGFDALYARKPFDLLVFDEASQVGIAHALALSPLGKRVVFAGDDKQLAPIVQSKHPNAVKWLGKSMFMYKKPLGACFLNEQSRMAEEICDVVSNVFYEGKLLVAEDAEHSAMWRAERLVRDVSPMGKKNVYMHMCAQEGIFIPAYGGPVRFASADFLVDMVSKLLVNLSASQIAVLCPYRAQRTLVKGKLRRRNIRGVGVNTVHRAQGTECHTVIFDAVIGDNDFLNDPEIGPRLLNVAFSRAQARLVVIASKGDLKNTWLRQIANLIGGRDGAGDNEISLEQVLFADGFPNAFRGTVVRHGNLIGRIEGREHPDKCVLTNLTTGAPLKLSISVMRRQYEKTRKGVAGTE